MFFFVFLFIYLFLFLIKWFQIKMKYNSIKPIEYKNNLKFLNLNIRFIYFFIFEIPKKFAFFYFYTFIKLIYSYNIKNKSSLLKIFKNKSIMKFFIKNFLFNILFKLVTTLPLFVVKNVNYIYDKIIKLLSYKRENFKSFLQNLLINLMIDYNGVFSKIKSHRIVFDGGKIYTNPKSKLVDALNFAKFFTDSIKNKTSFNIAHNDLNYGSNFFKL